MLMPDANPPSLPTLQALAAAAVPQLPVGLREKVARLQGKVEGIAGGVARVKDKRKDKRRKM